MRGLLLGGACVLAVVYAFGLGLHSRPLVLLAVVLVSIGVTALGYRQGRIDRSTAALFVAGLTLFEVGDLTAYATYLRGLPPKGIPSLQDAFYFLGYPFFAAAVTRLYARDWRNASAAILFSVTLAVAAGFVVWATVFSRFSGDTMSSTVLAGTYPVLDLVLVFGVAQAVVTRLRRRVWLPLLGGTLSLLIADLGYAFVGLHGRYWGSFYLPAFYVLAYAFLVAGISAASLGNSERIVTTRIRLSRTRIALMFLASVIAPFALIAVRVNHLNAYVCAGWIAAIVALVFAQFAALLTERGVAETQLRARDRELKTLVDHAPALLWATDPDLRPVSVSGAALTNLGWGADALRRLSVIVETSDRPEFGTAHRRALSGEPVDLDQALDGRLFRCHIEPLTDSRGDVVGTIGVGVDVTEQSRLEEQVLHAQRMEAVGQLAGTIAHDFNNLLTGISGYAELAASKLTGHTAARYVSEIRRAAAHGASLTNRLSIFSRKQGVEPSVVDANAIVAELSSFLARVIGESMTVAYSLETAPAPIRIDPRRFEQMIVNLVMNARDAMNGRGEVKLTTRIAGDRFALEVADKGVGMDEATQSRIFDAFFTTKEPGKGTGLGLVSVLAIVSEANGTIDVASKPEAGTTFTLSFPLARQELEQILSADVAPVAGGSESILLVDDNDQVRRLTATMLETLGYRVVASGTSHEALNAASSGSFDLLVTDVVLPDTDGRRLAGEIAAALPDISVLFISGFMPDDHVAGSSGQHASPQAFLAKPFSLQELDAAVRGALARVDRPSS